MRIYIGFLFASAYFLSSVLLSAVPWINDDTVLKAFCSYGTLALTVVGMIVANKLYNHLSKKDEL